MAKLDISKASALAAPLLKKLWRLLAAGALAYAFLIVLMSASIQAGVAERLATLQPAIDYGSASSIWGQSVAGDNELRQLRADRRDTAGASEAAERALEEANELYLANEAPLRALQRRLSGNPSCAFELPSVAGGGVEETLTFVRQCVTDPETPQTIRTEAERVLASAGPLLESGRKWMEAGRDLRSHQARLQRIETDLKEIAARQAERKAVRERFGELESFAASGWWGAASLAQLPPAVTQIVLVFVSGLFGGLLLTMVLIVHPHSGLGLTTPGGDYGALIMLGGLIAICVFVVIGGGTAVLGTSEPLAEGEANFLAFCTIGILSGMFSERVANWLSERANTFFSRRQTNGAPLPFPAPPPPPPAFSPA